MNTWHRLGVLFILMFIGVIFGFSQEATAQPIPPIPWYPPRMYLPLIMAPANPKHGLSWSYGADSQNAGTEVRASWYYHWAAKGWAHVPSQMEFVPMLWGNSKALRQKFLSAVPTSYCGFILFANEPEFASQSNMNVDDLVKLTDWLVEYYPCAKLVGPQSHVCYYEINTHPLCPNWGGEFRVERYIQSYRSIHGKNPPVVAYGLHYGDTRFWPSRIADMLTRYGIAPAFWYTEFNYCGTSSITLRNILDGLNKDPLVHRYAYWSNLGTDNCMLYDFETKLIDWRGRVYAEFGD